jgi:hypothetical protein
MPQQGRILRDETWASQSAANKGTSQNWNNKRGRLLAWIGDQVRLKALTAQLGPLYTGGGAASCYSGNNREEQTIRRGIIRLGTIAV